MTVPTPNPSSNWVDLPAPGNDPSSWKDMALTPEVMRWSASAWRYFLGEVSWNESFDRRTGCEGRRRNSRWLRRLPRGGVERVEAAAVREGSHPTRDWEVGIDLLVAADSHQHHRRGRIELRTRDPSWTMMSVDPLVLGRMIVSSVKASSHWTVMRLIPHGTRAPCIRMRCRALTPLTMIQCSLITAKLKQRAVAAEATKL
mmetsp:Transcript_17444/g.36807  ORF Transcript_17444/g.36807 Transcript_17444/m.36807 type:complete len:201 (+) Transcript_17444:2186-2788(+)